MKTEDHLKIIGIHTFTIRDAKTGKVKRKKTVKNVVCTVGRNVLARLLAGDNTYTGEITYGALGQGTATPATSDTQLGNEVDRVAVSSQVASGVIAYLSFFWPAGSEITYTEFGNFIDGTSSADTGQLFTRVLMSGTKSATETLTIDSNYTIGT
jgi:hypothetical protein